MSKDSVIEYDVTDVNNSTVNSVDIAENCDPGTINNAIRSVMSHQKEKLLDDGGISLTVAGTDTYTVTTNQVFAAYADGFSFAATVTNAGTGAATMDVTPKGGSALGAKAIKKNMAGTETAIASGDIAGGGMYKFTYDSQLASAAGGFWVESLNLSDDNGLISVQTFSSSGTWTKPAGIKKVKVEVQGGGAGGGGTDADEMIGAGGGAGGYAMEILDVTGTSSETVTVGAGGSGGASAAGTGTSGADSLFGAYCTGAGGTGGAGTSASAGGAGGLGTGGDLNIAGQTGGLGDTTAYGGTGIGGNSKFGWGAHAGLRGANGVDGVGAGSGGSGGHRSVTTDRSGGAGKDGIVIVWEYSG